jgi:hypothetical protein
MNRAILFLGLRCAAESRSGTMQVNSLDDRTGNREIDISQSPAYFFRPNSSYEV